MKIYAKTDAFMSMLMKELGIEDIDVQYDHLETVKAEEKMREDAKTFRRNVSAGVAVAAAALVVGMYVYLSKKK